MSVGVGELGDYHVVPPVVDGGVVAGEAEEGDGVDCEG